MPDVPRYTATGDDEATKAGSSPSVGFGSRLCGFVFDHQLEGILGELLLRFREVFYCRGGPSVAAQATFKMDALL